jgi:hypothetical protein
MAGLILSWENPTELFIPAVRKVTLHRRVGEMLSVLAKSDITWGVTEDPENDDVDAEYTIIYEGPFGEHIVTVGDKQIERYAKPASIARIDIELIRPDGAPDAGKCIEFSDEGVANGQFVRRIVTNSKGVAAFYAMPDSQLLVRVDGWKKAYHVVVPDVRTIEFDSLLDEYGTQADIDPRRSIGLVW